MLIRLSTRGNAVSGTTYSPGVADTITSWLIRSTIACGVFAGAINPNQGMQGFLGFMLLYMAAHPELMQRPVVVRGDRAVLGRSVGLALGEEPRG